MMTSPSKNKGSRIEREIVEAHRALGLKADRIDERAGQLGKDASADVDIWLLDEDPIKGEVKARKGGGGFVQLEKWLGDCGLLFLHRDRADPMVVVRWSVWERIVKTLVGAKR